MARRPLAAALTLLALGGLLGACGGAEAAVERPPPVVGVVERAEPAEGVALVRPVPAGTTVASATVPVVEVLAEPPADLAPRPEAVAARQARDAADARRRAGEPAPAAVSAIPSLEVAATTFRRTWVGWTYDNPTFFGNPLSFVVTEDHGPWLKVLLPARPNDTEGWVRRADVALSHHQARIEVDRSEHRVRAFDGDRLIAEAMAVMGAPSSPTPLGTFYVLDKVQKPEGSAYGPWILGTNAFSEALDSFDGGLPVIALHGTNRPELVGSSVSNGCIRLPNDVIRTLAAELPLGTPVHVYA